MLLMRRCRDEQASYPGEFRAQLVELVKAGRSPEGLSREFEPTARTIINWVVRLDRDAVFVTTG
jgi:transposase